MSDYLPIDVVQQVLLRLPIKPLLQCTSICKAWYNLITSTEFVHAHLDFTKSLPNSTHLFIHYYIFDKTKDMWPSDHSYVIYHDDKDGNFEECVRFPIKKNTNLECVSLVGCCNGLICLNILSVFEISPNMPKEVVLWNPVIRRTLRLPKSDLCIKTGVPPLTFGFVFDHIGNVYKVLRFYELDKVPSMVEVFRLRAGLWEYSSYEAPFKEIGYRSNQVDLKGISHWIGVDHNNKTKIITFDVHEEVFGSIELPFDVMNNNEIIALYKYLFIFEESLFLICEVLTSHGSKFDVWRTGDYNVVESWKYVHTWVFNELVTPCDFRKNGEILYVAMDGKLISTNLEDASVKYLGTCQNTVLCPSCVYYAESIILLDKSLSSAVNDQKVKMLQECQFF